MYIGISKFSASTSDHKPVHVFRSQQEVAYICILHHTVCRILLNLMFMYHNLLQCNKEVVGYIVHITQKFHDGEIK